MADTTVPAVNPPLPFEQFIGSAVRWGMAFVGSWLLEQGLTNASTTGAFIEAGTGIVMALTALGWAFFQKWLAEKTRVTQVHAALSLPAGSTLKDLHSALGA